MLPIFEIFLNENEDAIKLSLVEEGAIQENFIYFNNEQEIKINFNDEKHIITGPAMIPKKLIYRNDNLGERYVFYSEDSIRNFVEMFLNKYKNKINIDHSNTMINAKIIESYFAKENNEFGVEQGSWIVSLKILDNEVWNMIKDNRLNAFSVEGLFVNQLVEMAIQNQKNDMKETLKQKLLSAIDSILFETTEAPEVVEETKEEVKEEVKEEFEMVDSGEVATKVDEKVAEAQMIVDQTAPEALTIDMVKTLLEELRASIVDEFAPVMAEMEALKKEVSTQKEKVEEFSNQPISQSVVEEVQPALSKSDLKENKALRILSARKK